MSRKIGLVVVAVILGAFVASLWGPTVSSAGPITLSYANFPPAPTFPCVQMERWKKRG